MREQKPFRRLNPAERILLSPDLSNSSPRARQGLIAMLQGATDPDFLAVLNEARTLLRVLWRTANEDTLIVPGTEEAGLEATLVNLIEPGERVVVCVAGRGGERIAEAAERVGAAVERVETAWGTTVTPAQLRVALEAQPTALVAAVHGEGSTGVLQPLAELAQVAHASGALFVADVSLTTAVVEVLVDEWGLDACWAGSQKGLSAYPGLALISFGRRAAAKVDARTSTPRSWYLDLDGLRAFASDERRHQTFPAPLLFALTEVLQLAQEQSMEYRERRHRNRRDALVAALTALGLEVLVNPAHRLPSVTVARVPTGVDGARVRERLVRSFRIDIGSGLGAWGNDVWRIGVMSHSAQPSFIISLISALEFLLGQEGYSIPRPGAAVEIAIETFEP